ncbi:MULTISPECIES: hypothetical protein [unclassified Streptomyces]|uniref:hypothetical protein n=1 Tax=unclassified Streptomyces TaxID=2593676 RepID=UPI00336AB193
MDQAAVKRPDTRCRWPDYDDKKWLDGWLRDPENPDRAEFFAGLIPFADATGSGSVYALWRCDDRADLTDLPVVFLGDEGDVCSTAQSVKETRVGRASRARAGRR